MNRLTAAAVVTLAFSLAGCGQAGQASESAGPGSVETVRQGDGYTLKKIPRDRPPTPATRVPGSEPGDGVTPNYDTPLNRPSASGDSPKAVTPAPAGSASGQTAGAK